MFSEQKKLLLLFALLTDRRPADLARIGYSQVHISEDGTSATYRLQRSINDWSAELTLNATPNDELVCPVACLAEFLKVHKTTPQVMQPPISHIVVFCSEFCQFASPMFIE
jgi:hypothetical protein